MDKIVGRKTNRRIIQDIFAHMEGLEMGKMTMKLRECVFQIRDDILSHSKENTDFRHLLYSYDIS